VTLKAGFAFYPGDNHICSFSNCGFVDDPGHLPNRSRPISDRNRSPKYAASVIGSVMLTSGLVFFLLEMTRLDREKIN
jgi:hypothetical protein